MIKNLSLIYFFLALVVFDDSAANIDCSSPPFNPFAVLSSFDKNALDEGYWNIDVSKLRYWIPPRPDEGGAFTSYIKNATIILVAAILGPKKQDEYWDKYSEEAGDDLEYLFIPPPPESIDRNGDIYWDGAIFWNGVFLSRYVRGVYGDLHADSVVREDYPRLYNPVTFIVAYARYLELKNNLTSDEQLFIKEAKKLYNWFKKCSDAVLKPQMLVDLKKIWKLKPENLPNIPDGLIDLVDSDLPIFSDVGIDQKIKLKFAFSESVEEVPLVIIEQSKVIKDIIESLNNKNIEDPIVIPQVNQNIGEKLVEVLKVIYDSKIKNLDVKDQVEGKINSFDFDLDGYIEFTNAVDYLNIPYLLKYMLLYLYSKHKLQALEDNGLNPDLIDKIRQMDFLKAIQNNNLNEIKALVKQGVSFMDDESFNTIFPAGVSNQFVTNSFSLSRHWLMVSQCRSRYVGDQDAVNSCIHSRMNAYCLEQGTDGNSSNCGDCGNNVKICNKTKIINYLCGFKGQCGVDTLEKAIAGDESDLP